MNWKLVLETLQSMMFKAKPEGQPVERGIMIPVSKIIELIKKHRRKNHE